jgi:hypothetical protein
MKLSKSWIKGHYYVRTKRMCPSTMKRRHDEVRLILFAIANLAIIIIARF